MVAFVADVGWHPTHSSRSKTRSSGPKANILGSNSSVVLYEYAVAVLTKSQLAIVYWLITYDWAAVGLHDLELRFESEQTKV